MKLPLKWLKDYVDYNVTHEEFANRMLLRGFEVAEIIPEMPGIKNVYVCTITGIEQHPNAERLRICDVDVGREEPLKIVTNATNVTVGCQVPVALDGAVLADGMEIKPTKMRGVMSYGMFCGGAELGITDAEYEGASNDSVLILNEQHENGQRIQEALDLDDVIFNIELTPNRPDCQSIIGICREAASALGQKFHEPVIEAITGEGDASDYASVTILNPELCPRYCARVVTDLKIEPSPRWMQQRLRLVGLRPINNIVDITNYVLVEYGHPMHAFDLACVEDGHIIVRNAYEGEHVTTLDGKERIMSEDMLLIADPNKGVGIAGVMGGENSEITANTKATLFESAVFIPANIRHTTKKLHHSTDSSARFVKGVEAVNAEAAVNRAIELVHKLNAGRVIGGMIDVCSADISERKVSADYAHVNRILDTDLSPEKMCELLSSINIPCEIDGDKLNITVPHFRTDIESGIETDWDIAEEIGRLYGYENIPATLMNGDTFQGKIGKRFAFEDLIKDALVSLGFMETYNFNFTSPQEYDNLLIPENDEKRQTVRLRNPFGEDQSLMRTTLIGGALRTALVNCNRKSGCGRFFEVGNVHFNNNPDGLPEERKLVNFMCFGPVESFYSAKGAIEQLFGVLGIENARFEVGGGEYLHPGKKAIIKVDSDVLGEIGAVNSKVQKAFGIPVPVFIVELSFDKLLAHSNELRKFKPMPKFPVVQRDIAIVLDKGVEAQTVIDIINTAKTKVVVENCRVFDVYYPKVPGDKGIPEGKKSMAFSFDLRSDERTLNDEDINQAVKAILKTLKFRLDADLRS